MTSPCFPFLRTVGGAFAAATTVAALAGCSHVKAAFQSPESSPPVQTPHLPDQQQGALYQQQGVMTKQDYLRLVKIQDGIDRTQRISDEDVAFIARELNSLPVQNTSKSAVQAQEMVLAHTYASPGHKPKQLTPSQRGRLYNAILPYTGSSDQWVQVGASLALAGTRDPRAIGVLNRMAQSSQYPVVRMDARTWLKRLRGVGVTADKAGR